jgi:TonB family protein
VAQAGAAPVFTEAEPVQRKPRLRNAPEVGRRLARLMSEHRQQAEWDGRTGQSRDASAGRPRLNAEVKLRVLPDGSVSAIEFFRSSGDVSLDRQLAEVVRRMRFDPPLVDDVPVPMWVIIPMNLGDFRA